MIVPEGAILKLDPRDDLMHRPEAASNYNESAYLDLFDATQRVGLWLRLGNRPHENHAEISICIYLPDGSVAFWFARPTISSNDVMDAGGLRIATLEPFKHFVASYDGPVLLLKDPNALGDPKTAFETSPRTTAHVRLQISGISPMHGGEIVNPDGSTFQLDSASSAYRGHLEQYVSGQGELTIGDSHFEIAGFGCRDRSWGPRYWQNLYWHKWTPVTFGLDLGVTLALMGQRGLPPFVNGTILRNGTLHTLRQATFESDRAQPSRFTVKLRTDADWSTLQGTILSAVPLRHRRPLPNGGEAVVRIVKSMTSFTFEGRQSLGMSEFLDLLEDGKPVSDTDVHMRRGLNF